MTWIRFRIEFPDGTWLGDVTRTVPNTNVRLVSVVHDGDVGYTHLAVAGHRRDDVATFFEAHDAVEDVSFVANADLETRLHVTGVVPRVIGASRDAGLPVELPTEIVDGRATVEVVGDHDTLSAFGRRLASVGVAFDVMCVGPYDGGTRLLTETQRDLVVAATEAGYYETPRRCTLTELADRRGIAKSTCSETLQRAEGRLMDRYVDELPPRNRDEVPAKRTVLV